MAKVTKDTMIGELLQIDENAVIDKTELTVNTLRVHEQIIDKGSDQRKIYDRLL